METVESSKPRTLEEFLVHPFEPLTIKRSMTLFPTALGLKPGLRALPSDDFLANLLTGRRSYLAVIRRGFGSDFKNFENYAFKRVRTTTRVHQRLIKAVGGEEQLLDLLAELLRNGLLTRQLAGLTRAAEGLVYQLMAGLSSGSRKCTCCGNELVSRPEAWWQGQNCVLGDAEYRFVDRVLYDVLASAAIPRIFRSGWYGLHVAAQSLAELCDPASHPFKHWLAKVQRAYRAKDLTALAVRSGLEGQYSDSHLQRCARGEMLTAETIEEVTARLAKPDDLRGQGMHARAVAFAIDFLVAADARPDHLAWPDAQAVVRARITQLAADLWLSRSKHVQSALAPAATR
ncbi:MAG: hypothetical protein JNM33_10030 [Rubrivivax sp.]|nr:hypothetical protein [Rubrivivax sp.]